MCLYQSKKIEKEDFKGILCYKVLYLLSDGSLHSPFYDYEWELGKTERIENGWEIPGFVSMKPKEVLAANIKVHGNITNFAFHTFKNLKDAVYLAEDCYIAPVVRDGEVKTTKAVVAECLIPSDTEYVFEGTAPCVSHYAEGYASQSLTIIRIMSPEEYTVSPEEE